MGNNIAVFYTRSEAKRWSVITKPGFGAAFINPERSRSRHADDTTGCIISPVKIREEIMHGGATRSLAEALDIPEDMLLQIINNL